MTRQKAVAALISELKKAEIKHPKFPTDIIHAVSIMNEEAGESIKSAYDITYADGSLEHLINEVAQTGAMCLRILENIGYLKANPSEMVDKNA